MIGEIEKLDKQGLRKFGLITGAIVVGLFGLLLPWLLGINWPLWPWYLAGALWVLAIIIPVALNPIYHVWMRFGLILGWINTRIILGLVFYVFFTPFALILKVLGKDPMSRKLNASINSYRVPSNNHQPREHMGRPF